MPTISEFMIGLASGVLASFIYDFLKGTLPYWWRGRTENIKRISSYASAVLNLTVAISLIGFVLAQMNVSNSLYDPYGMIDGMDVVQGLLVAVIAYVAMKALVVRLVDKGRHQRAA